jgi:hypothetical protein
MSVAIEVRKVVTIVEEIHHEFGPPPASPRRRGAIVVAIKNPYAGSYVKDITPMMEALKPLGLDLSYRLIAALGCKPDDIQAYGKGAIVGEAGELEHGALWHVPGGYGMRELLGGAKAIVPSAKKLAGIGSALDVPIGHIDAAYVRSHFDAMEVSVPDAPRAGEIVYILDMTTGPRVHERVGGLRHDEIKGEDGLR